MRPRPEPHLGAETPTAEPPSDGPDVSVVICSIGKADVARCITSVVESAEAADARLDLVIVWQTAKTPPELPAGTRLVPAFPTGVTYARNKGLSEARAPVVAFIDDDEVADPTWIPRLLTSLGDPDVEMPAVFGAVEPMDEDGRAYCHYSGEARRTFESPRTMPWVVGTEGNMAFRTDLLRAAGGFDRSFGIGAPGLAGEGTDLVMRLLSAGTPVQFAPDVIVYHPSKNAAQHLISRYPYGFGMGRVIRRHRDVLLGAKYAAAGLQYLLRGIRSREPAWRAEAIRTLLGFGVGAARRSSPLSPQAHLVNAPHEIAARIDGAPVRSMRTRYEGRPHFLYRIGDDVLHVYASPPPTLVASVPARAAIPLEGIPQVRDAVEQADALWLIEDLVPGDPVAARAAIGGWYPSALEWAERLAGGPRRRLEDTPTWAQERSALEATVPASSVDALGAALDVVGGLLSVPTHGALGRGNLLLERGRIGVVSWGLARLEGIPGDDILRLTATASSQRARSVLSDLVEGREPPFGHPLGALERLGIDRDALVPVLLVLLARWRAEERSRLSFPAGHAAERPFEWLFTSWAPELQRAMRTVHQ